MRIISDKTISLHRPNAMTIGKFDGIHLGHMALLNKTIGYSVKLSMPSIVFTFHPNPVSVLSGKPFKSLISENQKMNILSAIGIDILINYPFDRAFADISPDDFMRFIFEDLQCRALIIGESFRFGKGRMGEASTLVSAGNACGAIVEIVKSVDIDGEPVSSTRIREAIADKKYALAERLLGRPLSNGFTARLTD